MLEDVIRFSDAVSVEFVDVFFIKKVLIKSVHPERVGSSEKIVKRKSNSSSEILLGSLSKTERLSVGFDFK